MRTKVMERRNWWTMALIALAAVMALVMVFSVQSASADNGSFDITVRHGINGRSLGLEKDLPVNVYVNGALTIPDFMFGESISTSLEAGTYTITVTLADGTPLPSMDLGPVDISAGADVDIKAKLSANKTPILKVKVK